MNRYLSYSFFMLFGICVACNEKKNDNLFPIKIAKTVPGNFINASDTHFIQRQDTIYYDHDLFTGFQFVLDDKGDTLKKCGFFNGVEEGLQQKWYPNGRLEEERFYINGKKEGLQQGWWPNGQMKFHFTAYDNEYEGEFREWLPNGLLIKCFHYEHGYEKGSQRLWWNDGTVRANYVIKDGKKYGLLGLKICNNPYDSVSKR